MRSEGDCDYQSLIGVFLPVTTEPVIACRTGIAFGSVHSPEDQQVRHATTLLAPSFPFKSNRSERAFTMEKVKTYKKIIIDYSLPMIL